MQTTRRSFLTGLGAAICATAIPLKTGAVAAPIARIIPRITTSIPHRWPLTAEYLYEVIHDLYRQAAALEPLGLTETERDAVARDIDDEIDNIRPIGVKVLIEAKMWQIAERDFMLVEPYLGLVIIKPNL